MKKIIGSCVLASSLLLSCQSTMHTEQDLNSEENLRELVTYTYPYVAGFNAINNLTMPTKNEDSNLQGWNKINKPTKLFNHLNTGVPRPNNDTLYVTATLDIRNEPVILTYPAFDSDFIALEVSSYDHSVSVPLSTANGDFQEETSVLFYSDITENFIDFNTDDYDKIIKLSGSLGVAFVRMMPHQAEPIRLQKNLDAIQNTRLQTYSEYHNLTEQTKTDSTLPAFGTDMIVYSGNLLETMQYIVDHLSFSEKTNIDEKMLSVIKKYGVEPHQQNEYVTLNTKRLLEVLAQLKHEVAIAYSELSVAETLNLFKPTGESSIQELITATVLGPLGLPSQYAVYPKISTADNTTMNALYDYKISMTKDELPPAHAFWSFTVYDTANYLFIPNEYYKYSVGENAGMQLNSDGGIDIYISAEKPEGVPTENWIPINRQDEEIGVTLRIYDPDIEKYKTYTLPVIEKLSN